MMLERLAGKRALITGATSGLGEALALGLAADGWRVVVTGRSPAKVERTAEAVSRAGGTPLPLVLEVTEVRDFENAADAVQRAWGGIDLLVNNAGIAGAGRIDELTLDAWERVLRTNLWSAIYGCRTFAPLLRRQGGGHIVNVASAAGVLCAPEMSNYSVSKAGIVALSETLHVELAPDHVGVTVVVPGIFQSDILSDEKLAQAGGQGRMLTGIRGKQRETASTSAHVAAHVVACVEKRRLFCLPHADMRVAWWLKRMFPELNRRVIGHLARKRLWVFSKIDD